MRELLNYIKSRVSITASDIKLIETYFTTLSVSANTKLLEAGQVERYIYFLSSGIVKGYQNIDGKIVIQHLIEQHDVFTSLESFMTKTPSIDYYETVTNCTVLRISKKDFDFMRDNTSFWNEFVELVTNEHLNCKLDRVKDFQLLTAKERYLKFINQFPNLALNVSVENMASFLGIEPQSLSRIRKQVTF
ncbi:Crp/Fnr family transcriptional regulator [uncultured Lacinutrix sp.]|uniref:Crp/Fnr family transcriptional regulator n=1 Tax=uncultured Lacinutrix sp. TaxID=574032 RepID=UPI00262C4ACF|nr:Crp/Fnr family transcriptional regulator [uncultured Lacinutrix sp.]